ncbi:hypothetical protein MRB53_012172 [Persea americana]|uniref:Uncharacterized protein n=1 Tax=Persea americana TaxID=3435 RepID=A0ACC2LWX2_PERAE|nr:hypothetical protein MRB53_012172 [Persea americana]
MKAAAASSSSSSSQDLPHQLQRQDEPNKNTSGVGEIEESKEKKRSNKLKLIPLIFLIFFEVSGGPFGEEPAVAAAGPLLAILGFIIFPFIWRNPRGTRHGGARHHLPRQRRVRDMG